MTDPDTFADNWAKAQESAYQDSLERSDKFNEWCDEQVDALVKAINKGDFDGTFPTYWGDQPIDEIMAEYLSQMFTMQEIAKMVIKSDKEWLPEFEAWYRDMIFEYGEME